MLGRSACFAALVVLACTPGAEPAPPPTAASGASSPTPGPAPAAGDAPAGDPSAATSPLASEPPAPRVRDDLYVAPKAGGVVRVPGTGAAVHAVADVTGPVHALAADPQSRVYAAERGGVHVIDDGVVTRTLPSVDVGLGRALHAVSERDVWYVGFDGVAHFDGDAWAVTSAAELGLEYPTDVTVDAQGRVWVLGLRGVVRRDGERFSPVELLSGTRSLRSFVDAPEHGLSIVHVAGIDHFVDETERWTKADLAFVFGAHIPTGRTLGTSAADYGGGAITVASSWSVTTRRAPNRRIYEVRDEKYPVTELLGVAVDERGRSWIATDGGLLLLDTEGVDPTWIGPGAIPGVEGEVAQLLVLGQGPPLPTLVDPGRGSVTGTLRHHGKPLAGARIQLCSSPNLGGSKGQPCELADPFIFGATTAADGTFEAKDVIPGRYRMAAYEASSGWRYLDVDECCLATRPGKPQDLGIVDTREGGKEGW